MAEIVALSGQSFPQVWDGMTWCDYVNLTKQWAIWPPAAISLAFLAKQSPQHRAGPPRQEDDPNAIEEQRFALESLLGPMPATESAASG